MEARDRNGLTEAEFLNRYAKKTYPKPSLTADIVVFAMDKQGLNVLLVKRSGHPYIHQWALPGGFAMPAESLEAAAARELQEETGLTGLPMQLVGVYSQPGRDPRGWVVSAAYRAVAPAGFVPRAGDDAGDARWFRVSRNQNTLVLTSGGERLAQLAFDHAQILSDALNLPGLPTGNVNQK